MSTTAHRPVRPTNSLITLTSSRPDLKRVSSRLTSGKSKKPNPSNSVVNSSNYQHFCLTSIGWQLESLNVIDNTTREENISKMLHGVFGSENIKLCQQAVIKTKMSKQSTIRDLATWIQKGQDHRIHQSTGYHLIRHRELQNMYWALCSDSIHSVASSLLSCEFKS